MFSALLTSLSCWGLVLALIFGPWAYASTRPECMDILNTILFSSFALWVAGWFTKHRWPALPLPLIVCTALILAQGWWMVWNSHGFVDPVYFQFIPGLPPFPNLPGSKDGTESFTAMLNISATLLGLLMAVDLAVSRHFRLRLLASMLITGTTLSLFAFFILKTQMKLLSWPYGTSPFMFGPFRYHGNAGAFLNLVWPLAAAFTLQSFLRVSSPGLRIFYAGCTALLMSAVAINASKGGQVVAVALFCVALVSLFIFRERIFGRLNTRKTLLLAGLVLVLGGAVLGSMDLEQTEKRWNRFSEQPVDENRLGVSRICLQMIPQAGFFGFGTSTFTVLFPTFNQTNGNSIPWRWRQAHQDYLQTVIEWGYVGTFFWTFLVAGGFFRLGYTLGVQTETGFSSKQIVPAGIFLCLAGVFLHSLIDFPLQVPSLRLYVLVLLGMAWASPAWLEEKSGLRKKRRIQASIPVTEKPEPRPHQGEHRTD